MPAWRRSTLGVPETGAMAQHHPGMRPQDGDMVGDGLRIRGADADIDHADPRMIGAGQVIGRHLVPPPAAFHHRGHRVRRRAAPGGVVQSAPPTV